MLVSGTKYEHIWAKLGDDKVWESNEVNLLVVRIVKINLNLTVKANQKISLLSRFASLFTSAEKRVFFKAFSESQFVLSFDVDVL